MNDPDAAFAKLAGIRTALRSLLDERRHSRANLNFLPADVGAHFGFPRYSDRSGDADGSRSAKALWPKLARQSRALDRPGF